MIAATSTPTSKVPFGPEVQRMLHGAGIPAANVTRRRDEPIYTVDFFNPEMQSPTKPAKVWAAEITSNFKGITVIDTTDTVAVWRPGAPVVAAMIQFRGVPVVADVRKVEEPKALMLHPGSAIVPYAGPCRAIVLYTGQ